MTANVISKRFHEEYRRSLIAIPTREAEYVYVERAKRGDRAAKDRLLYKYIPFLYKMAYQLRDSAYNLTVDEMVNAAIFGFPKALKEFDSSLGLLFYTYYSAKALNEMKKAGYESLLVRRPENQLKSKSLDKESVIMASIDQVNDDGLSIKDRMASDMRTDESTQTAERTNLANMFMLALSGAECDVISRLYIYGDEKPTLRSVGVDLNLSHERVRQLKESALRRIRGTEKFMDMAAEAHYFRQEAV
jgi:RNA polymerase primary sigma factor